MTRRLTCKNCTQFLSCDLATRLRVLSIQIKDAEEKIRPTKPFQMELNQCNREMMRRKNIREYERLREEHFNVKQKLLKCFRRRKWLYENKGYELFTEEEIAKST